MNRLLQQVKLFVRVEQVVIFAATVIGFQYVQKIEHVKIFLTGVFLFQDVLVLVTDELVEGVESGIGLLFLPNLL